MYVLIVTFFIKLYVRICSIVSYIFIRNFTVYICHFVNIYLYRIDVYLIYPSYIYLFVQDMMWSICNLPHHLFNASIYLSSIPLTIYPAIYIEYNRTKVSIYLSIYINIYLSEVSRIKVSIYLPLSMYLHASDTSHPIPRTL